MKCHYFPVFLGQLGDQLKQSDLRLYDLVRRVNKPSDLKVGNDLRLNLGCRSEYYFEDLKDLCGGDILEEDLDSFSYVAGFDALTCGHLFLTLINILEAAKVDCFGAIGEPPPQLPLPKVNDNYLKLFLEGKARQFRNKMFEAPVIPDRKGAEFLEVMKVKRYYLNKLIEEKEKEKKEQDIAKRNDLIKNLNGVKNQDSTRGKGSSQSEATTSSGCIIQIINGGVKG